MNGLVATEPEQQLSFTTKPKGYEVAAVLEGELSLLDILREFYDQAVNDIVVLYRFQPTPNRVEAFWREERGVAAHRRQLHERQEGLSERRLLL